MTTTAEQLFPQVEAAASALAKLSVKEREQKPHKQFAENYNNLLATARETMPSIDPRRWPPTIEIHTPAAGLPSAKATYVEFHSYYKQISAILAEGITPHWGSVG